jgi:hypothetical protein
MHAACKEGISLNFEDRVEQLFQAPCWVIDPLPFQVPAGSEGQFFAVEDHWLKPPQITELRQRFVRLLQKLNCYCDLEVAHPDEPVPVRNPAPEDLARKITDAQSEWVILIPSQDTLITLSRGDLYMSVYHPSEFLLRLLSPLAASEGLFFWQPSSSAP